MSGMDFTFLTVTDQAEIIKPLIWYFCIAGGVVLMVVTGLVIYVCKKFKARPDDAIPKQTTGNVKVEIITVTLSIALVVIALLLTIGAMRNITTEDDIAKVKTPDVILVGHQWWWEAIYPGTGITTANEIHLPVNKKLLLELKSADVIHDWSVPAFGPKMDMIPGKSNYMWLTIRKAGVYSGQCNQFCGIEHARMRIKVLAQNPADFQKWITLNKPAASQPTSKTAMLGAELFQAKTCGSCHQIRGTPATNNIGPDLTHLMDRKTILAGLKINNKENLMKWIEAPQTVKVGAHMPAFAFQKDSLSAIVDYLSELK